MADLTQTLNQFLSRYRRALFIKVGVFAVLGLGALIVLGVRLCALGLSTVWHLWLPVAVGVASAVGMVLWIRHRWISRGRAAADLDKTFGLKQRLITAEEFAETQQVSSLYPLLVEDASRRLSPRKARLPRPVGPTAVVLAVLLLILLLWPFRGAAPIQLAGLPKSLFEPPPEEIPPEPQSQEKQKSGTSEQQSAGSEGRGEQSSGNDSRTAQGESGEEQSSGGSRDSSDSGSSRSQGKDQNKSSAGDESAQQQGTQGRGGAEEGEDSSGQLADASAKQGAGADARKDSISTQEARSLDAQRPRDKGQESGSSRDQRMAEAAREPSSRGEAESTAKDAAARKQLAKRTTDESQAASRGKQSAQNLSESGKLGAKGGSISSMAQSQALKEEIQELLQQLSGELQTLQEQLGEKNKPRPEAGTTTDPELYGPTTKLESQTGETVPIQIKVDSAKTQSTRPGGGVGKPSGEVSDAKPQIKRERAQLAAQSLEEVPVSRKPIPPEYRSVFEHLYERQDEEGEVGE